MTRPNRLLSKSILLSSSALLCWCAGCSQPESVAATPPFDTTLSVPELMSWVLDPAADQIWGAAGSIITADGEQNLAPTDDEGWERVRQGAAVVIETANLLLLPARALDDGDWREFSLGLVSMGRKAMVAADAQDADALFTAGTDLYQVCVACHQQYDTPTNANAPGA